jgi:hypothetical protein
MNVLGVIYAIICGSFKLDWNNWNLKESDVPAGAGVGGFMPFGFRYCFISFGLQSILFIVNGSVQQKVFTCAGYSL